jgi:lipopolysaccharide transport system ATP-binding protein
VEFDDEPRTVVQSYLESGTGHQAEVTWEPARAPGNEVSRLLSVRVLDENGEIGFDHDICRPIAVEMEFRLLQECGAVDASIHLLNAEGLCLFAVGTAVAPDALSTYAQPGLYRATCRIPPHLLNDGKHFVSAFVVRNKNDIVALAREAVSFMAHDYGTARGGYMGKIIGAVRPVLPWDAERIGEAL